MTHPWTMPDSDVTSKKMGAREKRDRAFQSPLLSVVAAVLSEISITMNLGPTPESAPFSYKAGMHLPTIIFGGLAVIQIADNFQDFSFFLKKELHTRIEKRLKEISEEIQEITKSIEKSHMDIGEIMKTRTLEFLSREEDELRALLQKVFTKR